MPKGPITWTDDDCMAEIERLETHKDQCFDRMRTMQAEIERLRHEIDVQCSSEYVERILKENERLRVALAKSCEEGRDEMYDCGYNRLRVAYGQLEAENEKLKECIAEWQKDSALNGRW